MRSYIIRELREKAANEKRKIEKKIKSAITDSEGIVKFDKENKPGVSNLLTIHSIFSNESIEDLELRYADEGYGQFKQGVANAVLQVIEPIQEKYNALLDSEELDDILDAGQQKAEALANKTLKKAKKAMGLGRVRK